MKKYFILSVTGYSSTNSVDSVMKFELILGKRSIVIGQHFAVTLYQPIKLMGV